VIAAYLYLNALLYVVFAAWQTLSPWSTATAVGYTSLSQSGRSEYLVIYGGLQVGLAIFFGISGASADLHRPALLFALCLYSCIALYRIVTVMRFWPVKGLTLGVGALELALFIAALLLYLQSPRTHG
jgi:hypothetical protein